MVGSGALLCILFLELQECPYSDKRLKHAQRASDLVWESKTNPAPCAAILVKHFTVNRSYAHHPTSELQVSCLFLACIRKSRHGALQQAQRLAVATIPMDLLANLCDSAFAWTDNPTPVLVLQPCNVVIVVSAVLEAIGKSLLPKPCPSDQPRRSLQDS